MRFVDIKNENSASSLFPIGFATSINYTEQRQVQPLKAIGSRRVVFAATNSPVQITIERMLLVGMNTLRSLYANVLTGSDINNRNSKYSHSGSSNEDAAWFSNMEEDIFRVPIGLGVIYNAPASLAGAQSKNKMFAEYFEVCTLNSKTITIQSGQTMVAEQVQLYADRVLPWKVGNSYMQFEEEDRYAPVDSVSRMANS